MKALLVAALSLLLTTTALPQENPNAAVRLTNKDVVTLVKSGLSSEAVIAKIQSSRCNFDTEASILAELKHGGVPSEVIKAMIEAPYGMPPTRKAETPDEATEVERPSVKTVLLEEGADFWVTLEQEINSKSAVAGDPVRLKVDEDVRVGGRVVIKRGTPVKGYVSASEDSGMMGKGGRVGIRVESTRAVDGQVVRLRAAKSRSEGTATGRVVLSYILLGPLGFFTKGKGAKIKEGARVNVYVDEEKRVVVTPGQSQVP